MSNAPPVLCLVLDRVAPGGESRRALQILRGLAPGAFDLRVVSLEETDDFAIQFQKLSAPVHCLGLPANSARKGGMRVVLAVLDLLQILKRLEPEVVHTFGPAAEVAGRIASRFARVPRLLHTEGRERESSGLLRLLASRTASWLDCAVVESETASRRYGASRGLHPARLRRIAPGADLQALCDRPRSGAMPWSAGRPVIGTLGTVSTAGGAGVFLDAVEMLLPYHPNLHAVLAGAGPEALPYLREAGRRSLGGVAHFPGSVEDVPSVLNSFDVFVSPGRTEGIPLSLLEAMGACRPCVAVATGTMIELLEDGEHALLVPPDHGAGLADAIDRILTDDDLRLRLSLGGRSLVAGRYEAVAMAAAYSALYGELVRT